MKWERIRIKLLVGVIFSLIATLIYSFYTYGENCLNVIYIEKKEFLIKLLVFFLLGYFIIGNSFAPENKDTWK